MSLEIHGNPDTTEKTSQISRGRRLPDGVGLLVGRRHGQVGDHGGLGVGRGVHERGARPEGERQDGHVSLAHASMSLGCPHDPTTPRPTKDNSRVADLMVVFLYDKI